jgi:predicted nucleic acid-binding protein
LPKYERLVIDTVTISNFIKVGKLNLICELYRSNLYVTEAVLIELENGNTDITGWIRDSKIKQAMFDYDMAIQKDLPEDLADGEISCIVYGLKTNCAIATDDKVARRAIRDICEHRKLTGTVGLLDELVQEELITRQHAKELLEEMIEKGFWYKGDIPF